MSKDTTGNIERHLTEAGYGGLQVRVGAGVATLYGALPFSEDALAMLEAAWAFDEPGAAASQASA
jgi:hypothetical protein